MDRQTKKSRIHIDNVHKPTFSIGVVALNEAQYLPDMLSCIEAQTYPHSLIQIVLVDSGSHDATPLIMEDFANKDSDFKSVIVCQNPGKTVPKGWNVFLQSAIGEVIVRVDAHARIPSDFLSQIAAVLDEGEDVVGGPRPTITPRNASDWQRVLHAAEESLFGASIAAYRGKGKKGNVSPKYVKSIFHPGYRRSVIEKVGLFNEKLTRTEDNDYSYRIRKAGYRIRFDNRIFSEQIIRPSLRTMLKQKKDNGFWIGRTLYIQPGCVEVYHLVPAAFVALLAGGAAAHFAGLKWPLKLLAGSYLALDLALSVAVVSTIKPATAKSALLPAVFPAMHIGYGIGTWKGIAVGLVCALKESGCK